MLPQHMAPEHFDPVNIEAAGDDVYRFHTNLQFAALALQGQGGMSAAAASTSTANQPLHLSSARVAHSASATEATCSRKSGVKSLFRRLVPKCLQGCLPIAPAPAAKSPSPQVGSLLLPDSIAWFGGILCLCGTALWQQRQQACPCRPGG